MKFLVILISLALNHFWLRDHGRFEEPWFARFRANTETAARRMVRAEAVWWLGPALLYALSLLALGLLLRMAEDRAFGLFTMLLHVVLVAVAFDRTLPGKLARDFLEIWPGANEPESKLAEPPEDMQPAVAFLRREFRAARDREFARQEDIAAFFSKHLVYRSLHRTFALFFWYLVAGPYGVLACYLTYQLRDGGGEAAHPAHPKTAQTAETIVQLLEWIPLRLLALSFSLAGNFVHCFNQLKQSFQQFDLKSDNAALLYSFAGLALFDGAAGEASGKATTAAGAAEQIREIESLQALLERCQLLWLSLLALFTIFGPAF